MTSSSSSSSSLSSWGGEGFSVWRLVQEDRTVHQLKVGSTVTISGIDPIAGDYTSKMGVVQRILKESVTVKLNEGGGFLSFSNPIVLKPVGPWPVSTVAATHFFPQEQVIVNASDRVHFHGKEGCIDRIDSATALHLVDFGNGVSRDFLPSELKPVISGEHTLAFKIPPFPSDLSNVSEQDKLIIDLFTYQRNRIVLSSLLDFLEFHIESESQAEALIGKIACKAEGDKILGAIIEYFRIHGDPKGQCSSYCRSSIQPTPGKEWLFMSAARHYLRLYLDKFNTTFKTADQLALILGMIKDRLESCNRTYSVWKIPPLSAKTYIRDLLREFVQDIVTKEIMEDPVRISPCHHVMDKSTADKLKKGPSPRCPCCRSPFTTYALDEELKAHIIALKQMTTDNLESHIEEQ